MRSGAESATFDRRRPRRRSTGRSQGSRGRAPATRRRARNAAASGAGAPALALDGHHRQPASSRHSSRNPRVNQRRCPASARPAGTGSNRPRTRSRTIERCPTFGTLARRRAPGAASGAAARESGDAGPPGARARPRRRSASKRSPSRGERRQDVRQVSLADAVAARRARAARRRVLLDARSPTAPGARGRAAGDAAAGAAADVEQRAAVRPAGARQLGALALRGILEPDDTRSRIRSRDAPRRRPGDPGKTPIVSPGAGGKSAARNASRRAGCGPGVAAAARPAAGLELAQRVHEDSRARPDLARGDQCPAGRGSGAPAGSGSADWLEDDEPECGACDRTSAAGSTALPFHRVGARRTRASSAAARDGARSRGDRAAAKASAALKRGRDAGPRPGIGCRLVLGSHPDVRGANQADRVVRRDEVEAGLQDRAGRGRAAPSRRRGNVDAELALRDRQLREDAAAGGTAPPGQGRPGLRPRVDGEGLHAVLAVGAHAHVEARETGSSVSNARSTATRLSRRELGARVSRAVVHDDVREPGGPAAVGRRPRLGGAGTRRGRAPAPSPGGTPRRPARPDRAAPLAATVALPQPDRPVAEERHVVERVRAEEQRAAALVEVGDPVDRTSSGSSRRRRPGPRPRSERRRPRASRPRRPGAAPCPRSRSARAGRRSRRARRSRGSPAGAGGSRGR